MTTRRKFLKVLGVTAAGLALAAAVPAELEEATRRFWPGARLPVAATGVGEAWNNYLIAGRDLVVSVDPAAYRSWSAVLVQPSGFPIYGEVRVDQLWDPVPFVYAHVPTAGGEHVQPYRWRDW